MTVPSFDRLAIETHVRLLHELAAATLADDDKVAAAHGILILLAIREGDRSPRPQRFAIGDVEKMVEAIMCYDQVPGINLYAPFCGMFSNLAFGAKGGERSVKHVFAAVADIDRDPGKPVQATIDVQPSYVIETSPGNFQYFFIFPRPLCAEAAKPVLLALHAAVGGDDSMSIPDELAWREERAQDRRSTHEDRGARQGTPCARDGGV